jgi:hypothetical protein
MEIGRSNLIGLGRGEKPVGIEVVNVGKGEKSVDLVLVFDKMV